MASRDLYPQEILQVVLDKSCAKAQSSIPTLAILSILAGGYIGFGYLAYLKVVSGIPHEWGGVATLLGAAVFPIALICILLGGGELVTSNMMIMSLGRLAGRISSKMLLRNWVIVCMGNLVGTLAMAFFLGHYVGMTEGSVVYRATQLGSQTLLGDMMNALSEAQGSKAPIARVADKAAAVFVPAVVGIALLTFIVTWLVKGDWTVALMHAVAVLVIACPCALGLATPAAIMVGMGKAVKHGIWFKD
ncbi:MAG: formate/nitrite transporter family protein, partial [Neisseria sp.]|nr:formate/nitrite transporter family protein [Neisseria sp.]